MTKSKDANNEEDWPTTIAGTFMAGLSLVALLCQILLILQHAIMIYCRTNRSMDCHLFNSFNSEVMITILKSLNMW